MEMKNNVYLTKDLAEAGYLYMSQLNFLGLTSDANSTSFYFQFEDKEKAEGLSAEFWNKTAKGNINEYADALRTLKDLVFSKRRGNGDEKIQQRTHRPD